MQKFVSAIFFAVLTIGLAATAQAEPVTEAQISELRQFVTSAELEVILEQHWPQTSPQPEGCAEAEVDYDLAPAGMDKGYDWTISYIRNGDFQATPRGKGKVRKEGCWFKFDPGVSSDEAKKRIEASGKFLVADLWELNAFGQAKPDLQRKFPIIGLGSVWRLPDGNLSVPFLCGLYGRHLHLLWFDSGRDPRCRFLAVRKLRALAS